MEHLSKNVDLRLRLKSKFGIFRKRHYCLWARYTDSSKILNRVGTADTIGQSNKQIRLLDNSSTYTVGLEAIKVPFDLIKYPT